MSEPDKRRRNGPVPAVAASSLLLLAAFSAGAEDPDPGKVGRSLYRVYCASCHGDSGRGDGSTADYLTVKPADLTRLSRRNAGEFPEERLRKVIDGRAVVRGHGEREMPLWGLSFQDWHADRDQEAEVREKIDQLLAYLESIQKR